MARLAKRKQAEIQRDKETNYHIDGFFTRIISEKNRRRNENDPSDEDRQGNSPSQTRRPVHVRRENDETGDGNDSQETVSSTQKLLPIRNTHNTAVLSSLENKQNAPLQGASNILKDEPNSRKENDENAEPYPKRRVIDENSDFEMKSTGAQSEDTKVPALVPLNGCKPRGLYSEASLRRSDAQSSYNSSSGDSDDIFSNNNTKSKDSSLRQQFYSRNGITDDSDDDLNVLNDIITTPKSTTINFKPVVITQKDLEDSDDDSDECKQKLINRKAVSASPTVHYEVDNQERKSSPFASLFAEDSEEDEVEAKNASSPFVGSEAEFSIADIESVPTSTSLQTPEPRPQQQRRPTISVLKGSANELNTDCTLSPAEPESISQAHVPLANPRGENVLEKLGLERKKSSNTLKDDDDSQDITDLEVGNATDDDDDLPLHF